LTIVGESKLTKVDEAVSVRVSEDAIDDKDDDDNLCVL